MVGSLSMECRHAFKATEAMERRAEALSLAVDAEQARREILRCKEPLVDLNGKKSYSLCPDD